MSIKQNGSIAYISTVSATVNMAAPDNSFNPRDLKSYVPSTYNEEMNGVYAYWGSNNDYPQRIIEKMKRCGIGKSNLSWKSRALFSQGLMHYKTEYDENNKKVVKPINLEKEHKEIYEFNKRVKLNKFYKETIRDYYWFWMVFPEMIVSKNYQEITSIRRKKAAYCRWEVINKDSKRIENMYYSAKWPQFEDYEKIAVIDPYWTIEETRDYLRKHRIRKFIYPICYAPLDENYYVNADWHTVIENGWVDTVNAIPNYKKHLMENQMTIKYHVQIPSSYWSINFKDWEGKSDEDRDACKQEVLETLENFLSGVENSGKAFISQFDLDEITKKELPGWKITVLDDKTREGTYLADAASGNAEISYAQDVDPTIKGAALPGNKLGPGSGSDKREAFMIYTSLLQMDAQPLFEPWEFIRDFNGWPSDIKQGFESVTLTTLDKNPTGSENTIQPTG